MLDKPFLHIYTCSMNKQINWFTWHYAFAMFFCTFISVWIASGQNYLNGERAFNVSFIIGVLISFPVGALLKAYVALSKAEADQRVEMLLKEQENTILINKLLKEHELKQNI
jgi:hypothetical protein